MNFNNKKYNKPVKTEILNKVSKVIYVKSVSHGSTGGRTNNIVVMSIVANHENKTLGLGYAKAATARSAKEKSFFDAENRMEDFSFLFEKNTVPFECGVKFKASKLTVKPAKSGTGYNTNWVARVFFEILRVQNVTLKVHGSRHTRNVALGVLKLLRKMKFYNEVFTARNEIQK